MTALTVTRVDPPLWHLSVEPVGAQAVPQQKFAGSRRGEDLESNIEAPFLIMNPIPILVEQPLPL